MKIKISYSEDEKLKAFEMEQLLKRFLSNNKNLKIKKPEKKEKFFHTYMSI